MKYKCNYCDPVTKRGEQPIKSIDTDGDDFIKDEKNKYYHLECYKLHLKKRKKKSDEEISQIVSDRLKEQQVEIQEAKEKDRFLTWIMDFYDGSLPSFYLKKLQSVRNGTHESIREPIDYATLLDVYGHMRNYLNKVAAKKQFNNITGRMNYDLAVVIGNYGDYKRYKERQSRSTIEESKIDNQLSMDKKVKSVQQQKGKKDEFDITEVMDDLLL
jgi:hypothetical protein